jgi:hypothetical protein
MFNVGKVQLSFDQIAQSKTGLITTVNPNYDYVDGKRSAQNGYVYECVLHKNAFQSIRIKIEGQSQPSLTQEQIDASNGAVECEVGGFVGRIYVEQGTGRANLSSKATSITPVKRVQQQQ